MAIALDSGYAQDRGPGTSAGQRGFTGFGRRTERVQERLFYPTDSDANIPASIAGDGSPDKLTASEHPAPAAGQTATCAEGDRGFDPRLVKESFAYVAENSEAAMEYFYARLFVHYPEMRPMFPHTMRDHMERVFASLSRIVWTVDSPDSLAAYLADLGRRHRKFGLKDKHYEPFLAVLVDTIRHFNGPYWTDETQAAWTTALDGAAKAMQSAVRDDAARQPSWWIGEVERHDQRRPDLAVMTIRPDQPLRYVPGQYVAVQVPRWPRLWRNFSIANAPRENGLIDLHVRAVRGGLVSASLVHNTRPGDTVLLGRAQGEMTVPAELDRDLLCIAGGTGLAPLKAIIEGVLRGGGPFWRRKITLWFGARTEQDLYDLPDLRVLESICAGLKVIPVVSHQKDFIGMKGMLSDVTAHCASCEDREIFISGPDRMVRETARRLARRVGAVRIRHDPPDAARLSLVLMRIPAVQCQTA
jgi:NAD(P)H-flavin reductase/hemoglobin-like flavoprotein